MKTNIFIIILILLCSCNSQKPIATAHIERIEERLKPIAICADTIEIALKVGTRHAVSDDPKGQTNTYFDAPHQSDTACRVPTIESVRSTRAVNIQQTKTDTTQTLRITLRPDTVYLPYTTHIRSDTIVVQDKICKQKLTQSKTMNIILLIILILLVATIIYRKLSR